MEKNATIRNGNTRQLCDGDVLRWVRETSANIDCYCHGFDYSTGLFCETVPHDCSDAMSDLEQMRIIIVKHCASSNEFKNLAGGLKEVHKKAIIGNADDRYKRRIANVKPDVGIDFISDMYKKKDHKALVPVNEFEYPLTVDKN